MKKILILLFCSGLCILNNTNAGDTVLGLQGIQDLMTIQNTPGQRPNSTDKALDILKGLQSAVKLSDKNKAVGEMLKDIKYGLIPLLNTLIGQLVTNADGTTKFSGGALWKIANLLSAENQQKVQDALQNYTINVIKPKTDILKLLSDLIAPEATPAAPNPPAPAVTVPADAFTDF